MVTNKINENLELFFIYYKSNLIYKVVFVLFEKTKTIFLFRQRILDNNIFN